MEKLLKEDRTSFEISSGVTIEEFNDNYNKLLKDVKDKYGYITDIKIYCDSGEYNDGESYYNDIEIHFKRYETDEEFERRKYWEEYRKSEQEKKRNHVNERIYSIP